MYKSRLKIVFGPEERVAFTMAYNDCQFYPLVLYRLVIVVLVWAGRLFHVRIRVKVSTNVLI